MNFFQLKLEVHYTYVKDRKITTNFEAVNDEDVIDQAYLDEKLLKIDGHISYIEKDYNEFKIVSNKQSIEEVLVQRAVKRTKQILYKKKLFGCFPNAVEVFKDFLFVTRRRGDLEENE